MWAFGREISTAGMAKGDGEGGDDGEADWGSCGGGGGGCGDCWGCFASFSSKSVRLAINLIGQTCMFQTIA